MLALSWTATSRATVNGSQGRRTTLRIPSLETGITMTKNSTQCYASFPLADAQKKFISQIPSKINSWLTSLLQRLPMREQLWELHTMMQLKPGGDGPNIACPLDATVSIWTDSADKSKYSSLGLLAWLSVEGDSCCHGMTHWLKEQSEVPHHMWLRPFG
jgi:hypothetical protein